MSLNVNKVCMECIAKMWAGKGYPSGLAGAKIPVGARIIAICDSIDAMLSNRCYRKGNDLEFCYHEIEKNLGVMYDPIIGKHVLDNWNKLINIGFYDKIGENS